MEKGFKRKNKKTKTIINLKDTVKFFNENLKKKTLILFIIFAIICVVFLIPVVNEIKQTITTESTLQIHLWNFIKDKLFMLLITLVAGIVPYMYIALIGGMGYIYQALVEYGYIIVDKGYFVGLLIVIVPLILNLICISLATALGMYLCKVNTNKFKLGQQRNMNWSRFRLEFARVTRNEEKENKIQKKLDEKEAKLESMDIIIKYKDVVTLFVIICILQLISSLIEGLFI